MIAYVFYAEIWGTVSDWVMICVTAITAYLLFETLKSQTVIQKMQQRITDIEDFKFRSSLMPRFEVKGELPEYYRDRVHSRYYLLLNDKKSYNLNIRCESKCGDFTINNEWSYKSVAEKGRANFYHDIMIKDATVVHFEIRITATFEDIAGNRYMQYSEIIKPNPRTQSYGERTEPTLVSSYLDLK